MQGGGSGKSAGKEKVGVPGEEGMGRGKRKEKVGKDGQEGSGRGQEWRRRRRKDETGAMGIRIGICMAHKIASTVINLIHVLSVVLFRCCLIYLIAKSAK